MNGLSQFRRVEADSFLHIIVEEHRERDLRHLADLFLNRHSRKQLLYALVLRRGHAGQDRQHDQQPRAAHTPRCTPQPGRPFKSAHTHVSSVNEIVASFLAGSSSAVVSSTVEPASTRTL